MAMASRRRNALFFAHHPQWTRSIICRGTSEAGREGEDDCFLQDLELESKVTVRWPGQTSWQATVYILLRMFCLYPGFQDFLSSMEVLCDLHSNPIGKRQVCVASDIYI